MATRLLYTSQTYGMMVIQTTAKNKQVAVAAALALDFLRATRAIGEQVTRSKLNGYAKSVLLEGLDEAWSGFAGTVYNQGGALYNLDPAVELEGLVLAAGAGP